MANPVFVSCPAGVWTKILTAFTGTGWVHEVSSSPSAYLQTYRTTGDVAPTLVSEGVGLFVEGVSEEVKSDTSIDIYVMAITDNGSVRVDV